MGKQKHSVFIWLLVAALVLPLAGLQGKTASAAGEGVITSFSDVSQTHWASKFITKLALQEIIQGSEGKFSPDNDVTQQEAIIMVVRFMGWGDEQPQGEVILGPLAASDWAKNYVYTALKHQLINMNEEQALLDEDENWGEKPASREWISRLLIRALGEQSAGADASLSNFSDANTVSAWALDYVKAAVQLGLLNGIDGKIAPKVTVSRAQMATFLSQAEKYLDAYQPVVSVGRVASISENAISITPENSDVEPYTISSAAKVFRADQNVGQIRLSEIEQFDLVYIIHHGGQAYYIELMEEAELTTTEGTLAELYLADGIISLNVNGTPQIFSLSSSTSITDMNGNGMQLSELKLNSKIAVSQDPYQNDNKVVLIQVLEVPVNKVSDAKWVKQENGQVTVFDTVSGKEESYAVAESTQYVYGTRAIEASQLQKDDVIRYEVTNSVVTKVELITPVTPLLETKEGTFVSANYDDYLKTYIVNMRLQDNSLKAYYVTKDVKVTLSGMTSASMNDLVSQDQVRIGLNQNEEIVSIEVLNRSVEYKYQYTVRYYDQKNNRLLVDEYNETLLISEDTKLTAFGTNVSFSDAATYLTPDKKVDLVFTGNRLIQINISNKYTGSINKIDTVGKEITIATKDGRTMSFNWDAYLVVSIVDSTSSSVHNLKIGDEVIIALDNNNKFINQVEVKREKVFTVTEVNVSGNRLKLKDAAGKTQDLYLSSTVALTNESGTAVTLSSIAAGDRLIGMYTGYTLTELRKARISNGSITQVNTDAKSVVLKDYSGTESTVTLSSVSGLTVGDRIEVAKDNTGLILVTELTAEEKTFWKYDYAADVLYVKKKDVNDTNYTYNASDDVVFTSGGVSVGATAFKDGDKIKLYFQNGVLVEVAKL
ncbi:S-layer homology domain-containing protein [Marinicrinis lubricantis]|uniref:S-layer homology domain-containing protein n=1 Tax=Marinicrinis lubricantis TaxID=2086470 RepID=A0ABW1ILU2_9BACL